MRSTFLPVAWEGFHSLFGLLVLLSLLHMDMQIKGSESIIMTTIAIHFFFKKTD